MSDLQNGQYKKLFEESLSLNREFLDLENNSLTEIKEYNLALQNLLTRILENAKSTFPVFESIESKLDPEEVSQLVQFATGIMNTSQELMDCFKSYKKLEGKVDSDLVHISGRLRDLIKPE